MRRQDNIPVAAGAADARLRSLSPEVAAYGVVFSMGCVAVALAITLTAFLFNVVGLRRTRFAAQFVAAVVGALFVISLTMLTLVLAYLAAPKASR